LLDELIEQRRARAALDSILEKLGDGLRSVFVLHEIEQLTMSEISDALGIAPGTVASRLRRARERFTLLAARFRRYNREWSAMRWASGAR
jgi:RNA polymerase sigma-70 factor (ECF subfamily)